MINNKQVNIWRGDQEPPTLFHVWIYNNEEIRLYNGTNWARLTNDCETIDKINKLQDDVDLVKSNLNKISNATINNKLIRDNPVLNGNDLLLNKSGEFVNSEKSVSDSIMQLDNLFVTQIIG